VASSREEIEQYYRLTDVAGVLQQFLHQLERATTPCIFPRPILDRLWHVRAQAQAALREVEAAKGPPPT
jgi:hypothetical protein